MVAVSSRLLLAFAFTLASVPGAAQPSDESARLRTVVFFADGRLAPGARVVLDDDEPLPSGLSVDQLAPPDAAHLIVGEGGVLYVRLGTDQFGVTLLAFPAQAIVTQAPFDDCVMHLIEHECAPPANRHRQPVRGRASARLVHPWLRDVTVSSTLSRSAVRITALGNDAVAAFVDPQGVVRLRGRDPSMQLMHWPEPHSVDAWWYTTGGVVLGLSAGRLWSLRSEDAQPAPLGGLGPGERVRRICEDGRHEAYVMLDTDGGTRVARIDGDRLVAFASFSTDANLVACVRGGGVVAIYASSDRLDYRDALGETRTFRMSAPNPGVAVAPRANWWLWVSGPLGLMSVDLAPLFEPRAPGDGS